MGEQAHIRTIRLHPGAPPECLPRPGAANSRRTAKYSANPFRADFFLWKNLFEQLQLWPNLYFLFMVVLTFIPTLSPIGQYATLIEFVIVIFCSACKAAYEDSARHRSDRQVNRRLVQVYRGGRWTHIRCAQLQVGDVVRVDRMDVFPADLLLLFSSNEDAMAYIQTGAMDGDSTVKLKQCPSLAYSRSNETMLSMLEITVRYQDPSADIHAFSGTLTVRGQREALGAEHFLLCGAQLLQTDFVFGLVLYAGAETKGMKSVHHGKAKRSTVMRQLTRCMLWITAVLLLLVFVCTAGIIYQELRMGIWLLQPSQPNLGVSVVGGFFTFLILFDNVVPITLLFSLEVAQALQGVFIRSDLAMYSAAHDQPATVFSTALNGDLGQVQCVFMDKTGTLTCNALSFFKFAVEGVSYGQHTTEVGRLVAQEAGRQTMQEVVPRTGEAVLFSDPRIDNGQWQADLYSQEIHNLFNLMALCHTAIPHDDPSGAVTFHAQAQEDIALLKAAHHFGFKLLSRSVKHMLLEVDGVEQMFAIRNILPPTPERPRLSIIVRTADDINILYTKGPDSAVLPVLARQGDHIVRCRMLEHLRAYAQEGLRTLLCAGRTLTDDEYDKWNARYAEAVRRHSHEADVCVAEVEDGLDLIGAVAIEDTLQPDVPRTIASMAQAGMKLWMVTGDKHEAAVSTAYAAGLLGLNTEVIHLEAQTLHATYAAFDYAAQVTGGLGEATADAGDGSVSPQGCRRAKQLINATMDHGLVVSSTCLGWILLNPPLMEQLLSLSLTCRTVLCYRVTPAQKAELVRAVRALSPTTVTLAVGDGANDVAMIQAAHVGVAITGKEGMQAASAAEYALPQFSFLRHLLFVHGRWSHLRISKVVLFCFYKNVMLVCTQFLFALLNGFSGATPYTPMALSPWNLAWTLLPVLVFGVLEQDVAASTALRSPALYRAWEFSHHGFLAWVVLGAWHGLVVFVVVVVADYQAIWPNGLEVSMLSLGCLLETCCLVVSTLKLAMEISYWTAAHVAAILLSLGAYFAFWLILEVSPTASPDVYLLFRHTAGFISSFLILLLAVVAALGFDFCRSCYRQHVMWPPDAITVARYAEQGLTLGQLEHFPSPRTMRLRSASQPTTQTSTGVLARMMTSPLSGHRRSQLPMSVFTLRFAEPELEEEFRVQHLQQLTRYGVALALASAMGLAIAVYHTACFPFGIIPVLWYAFALLTAGHAALVFRRRADLVADLHQHMMLLLPPAFCFAIAADLMDVDLADSHPVIIAIITWGLLTIARPLFMEALQYIVLALVAFLGLSLLFASNDWSAGMMFVRWYELAAVNSLALATLYKAETVSRRLFSTSRQLRVEEQTLRQEREMAEALLLDMIPHRIVPVLNRHSLPLHAFSQPFTCCSILQSDIASFTTFSANRDAAYVVKMLNRMFMKFDLMAHRLRVEKIKTIGDAYVAAAGVPAPDDDHANKIAFLGLCLIDMTHELNAEIGEEIEIRVGVASGHIHAGFLGRHKVAYELYGETLREAELMEQTSRRMRVQCPPAMALDLRSTFEIETDGATGQCFVSQLLEDASEFLRRLRSQPEAAVPFNRDAEDMSGTGSDVLQRAMASLGPHGLRPLFNTDPWEHADIHSMDCTGRFKDAELEQRFRTHQHGESYGTRTHTYFFGLVSLLMVIPLILGTFSWPGIVFCTPLDIIYASLVMYAFVLLFSVARGAPILPTDQPVEQADGTGFQAHVAFSYLSSLLALAVTVGAICVVQREANNQISYVSCFIMMLMLLGLQVSYRHFLFAHRLVVSGVHLGAVTGVYFALLDPKDFDQIWTHIVAAALSLLLAHFQELETRQIFVAAILLRTRKSELTTAKKHSEALLYKVLPPAIVRRVYDAPDQHIVDSAESASVLFLYFHVDAQGGEEGDAMLMTHMNEVVAFLDEIVSKASHVEKIKTLPYLVVSGLPEPHEDHANALAALALAILGQLDARGGDLRRRCGLTLKMGLHSGKLCAGLLGRNKFIYDVFGDTVNVASRLASAAPDGRAMVSDEFVKRCEGQQRVEERGVVPLKGRGPMRCFYLKPPVSDAVTRLSAAPPAPQPPDGRRRVDPPRRLAFNCP
eukprot:EG_transcript_75